jgi:endonuclease/exonuclease/phosphatase family metal-dependent hydrolase
MRVLTYNIAGNRGRGRPAHLERVAALVREADVDLVGLQEVIHDRTHNRGPEDILAGLTGMHAAFLPAHQFRDYCIGNAVLCREPILETVSHELPHSWPERRVLLEVHTTARGLPVTAFCTHLVHMARMGSRLRLAQATAVARVMSTCWRPHVLVGDLNAGPHSRELHPVRKICVRHKHLGGISTWPARRPWILYDQIWPGPGWEVEDVRVMDLHVSDHRPLLAQLGWKGAPRFNIMPDEQYLNPPIR